MSQLPVRHFRARRIRAGKESAGPGVTWPASASRSRGSSAEVLEQAAECLLQVESGLNRKPCETYS